MSENTQVTREQIFEILKNILVNNFEIDESSISMNARLYEDFDIDSIDAVDMIVQIKPYLGNRNVSPEEFKQVRTVGDVVNVISKLLAQPEEP